MAPRSGAMFVFVFAQAPAKSAVPAAAQLSLRRRNHQGGLIGPRNVAAGLSRLDEPGSWV